MTLSRSERNAGRVVWGIFDRWQLSFSERLVLLGLPADSESTGATYSIIFTNEESRERVWLLTVLHVHLGLLGVGTGRKAGSWMKTPSSAFQGRSPIAMVGELGIAGLEAVLEYVMDEAGT